MNQLSKLPIDITHSRRLTLLLSTSTARTEITELIVALILRGPLFIVAASEWLPAYGLTQTLRKNTLALRDTLDRLFTVRASTCYRLLDSLINIPSNGEPILIIDFLHTFYEADIPLRVRLYKLRECCRQLKRLALYRPVIVMTQELQTEEYEKFFPALGSVADKTFTLEHESEQIRQPALF